MASDIIREFDRYMGHDLTPTETCGICDRREADCTVVIEDVVTPVCDTCFQRADDG